MKYRKLYRYTKRKISNRPLFFGYKQTQPVSIMDETINADVQEGIKVYNELLSLYRTNLRAGGYPESQATVTIDYFKEACFQKGIKSYEFDLILKNAFQLQGVHLTLK
jgi:hypothetical protein